MKNNILQIRKVRGMVSLFYIYKKISLLSSLIEDNLIIIYDVLVNLLQYGV